MSKRNKEPHLLNVQQADGSPKSAGLQDIVFSQFSDATPDPILITNTKGEICYVNTAWEKLTGYASEEVKGKNPRFLQSGKTPKRIHKQLWKSLSAGKSFTTDEVRDRRKDGTEYQIHATYFPLRKKNENKFYVQIQYDITKHEEALKVSEEKYRDLFENAYDLIFTLDLKGNFTSVNKASAETSGFSERELLKMNIAQVLPPEALQAARARMTRIAMGEKLEPYEYEFITKDGTRRVIELNSRVILFAGKPASIHCIARDITERKEIEQRKDDFISMASHELKTPITTVKALSQILLKSNGIKPVQRKLYLEKMNVQIDRLTDLITDLLDVSKIEKGKLEFRQQSFNFDVLVKETRDTVAQTSKTHKIYLHGKTHKTVTADRDRISQIIINLLTNAIKYSPEADKVLITQHANSGSLSVTVKDYGIGIPKKDQNKIFERFHRVVETTDRTFPGLGVGLYISQQIIKRHGGNLTVKSKVGQGSAFTFTLPLGFTRKEKEAQYLNMKDELF